MLYRPELLLAVGFFIYFSILLLAPLDPLVTLSAGALLFIFVNCLAFSAGSLAANFLRISHNPTCAPKVKIAKLERRVFYAFVYAGLIGNALRFIDKYAIRGAEFQVGMGGRDALAESSFSLLGIIGAAAYPLGFLPLFLYIGSRCMNRSNLKLAVSSLLFVLPTIDALMVLSRSVMISNMTMLYFAFCLVFFKGRMLPAKLLAPVALGISVLFVVSVIAFQMRLDAMELELTSSIINSAYGHTITPNAWALAMIDSNMLMGNLLSSALPILQYYTHSLFEFELLWSKPDVQFFTYGAQHLYPYVKLLLGVFPELSYNAHNIYPRVGVFTSFFGPIWSDFGLFSPIFMFLFGFAARYLARRAKNGEISAIPLYSYICVIVFYMPVVNFFITAQGMYVLNAFLLFFIISRHLSRMKPT